jgi:hypothetical protein
MSRWIFSLFFCVFIIYSNSGQIQFTKEFTKKLLDVGAEIRISEANWFQVAVCGAGQKSFDLCLESPRDSAELKYFIQPESEHSTIFFPEIHFSSKIAHIAANDDIHWIRTISFPARTIRDSLRADWAGELSFVPKASWTNKKYAKAFALYRESYGMIYVVLFYNFEFSGYNEQLHSISFYTKW